MINDLINQVHDRLQAYRKGDRSVHVTIDPSIDPTKGGSDAVPTAKITDLISFDDEEPASSTAQNGNPSSVLDDFASLNFENPSHPAPLNGQASSTPSGGLPADLFNPANASKPYSTAGAPLGQWGALQLPVAGSASSEPAPATSQSPQPGNLQGVPATTGTNSSSSQQASSDPFADLSKW